jgi:hypothetical protein
MSVLLGRLDLHFQRRRKGATHIQNFFQTPALPPLHGSIPKVKLT